MGMGLPHHRVDAGEKILVAPSSSAFGARGQGDEGGDTGRYSQVAECLDKSVGHVVADHRREQERGTEGRSDQGRAPAGGHRLAGRAEHHDQRDRAEFGFQADGCRACGRVDHGQPPGCIAQSADRFTQNEVGRYRQPGNEQRDDRRDVGRWQHRDQTEDGETHYSYGEIEAPEVAVERSEFPPPDA